MSGAVTGPQGRGSEAGAVTGLPRRASRGEGSGRCLPGRSYVKVRRWVLTTRVVNTYIAPMSQTLQHEIRQTKPFASLEAEAFLSIARTAAVLDARLTESLKPHGLTPTQYNVLRILPAAAAPGPARSRVGAPLLTPGPAGPRPLDRLKAAARPSGPPDPE